MVSRSVVLTVIGLPLIFTGCGSEKKSFVGGWRDKDDTIKSEMLIRKDGSGKSSYISAITGKKETNEFRWVLKGESIVVTFVEGKPGPDLVCMLRPDGTLVSKSLNAKDSEPQEYTSFPDVDAHEN